MTQLADDFGEFLCLKVDLIKNDTDTNTVVPPVLNVLAPENKFEKLMSSLRKKCLHVIIIGSSDASFQ